MDVADVDGESFNLSVKNPNTPEAEPLREPRVIMEEIVDVGRREREDFGWDWEDVVRETGN